MLVTFKKTHDGCVLAIHRADGSVVVNRTAVGGFFAVHDLTHLVVESELGVRDAFFGLLASGWTVRAFEDKSDPRYASVPERAVIVEHIVGVLMRRAIEPARHDPELRAAWCEEVNDEIAASLRDTGLPHPRIAEAALAAIGDRLAGLIQQWREVSVGGQMRVEFVPRDANALG